MRMARGDDSYVSRCGGCMPPQIRYGASLRVCLAREELARKHLARRRLAARRLEVPDSLDVKVGAVHAGGVAVREEEGRLDEARLDAVAQPEKVEEVRVARLVVVVEARPVVRDRLGRCGRRDGALDRVRQRPTEGRPEQSEEEQSEEEQSLEQSLRSLTGAVVAAPTGGATTDSSATGVTVGATSSASTI